MQKITTVLCLSALAFTGDSCPSTPAITPKTCGDLQTAHVIKTLTTTDPQFLVQSGLVASGSSSCQAQYSLYFHWANTNRAYMDTTMSPLSNLHYSFHVNSDGVYFPDAPNPARLASNSSEWYIVFSEHNSTDTSASNFYIKTSLNSTNLADSVIVDGTVNYYLY